MCFSWLRFFLFVLSFDCCTFLDFQLVFVFFWVVPVEFHIRLNLHVHLDVFHCVPALNDSLKLENEILLCGPLCHTQLHMGSFLLLCGSLCFLYKLLLLPFRTFWEELLIINALVSSFHDLLDRSTKP